MRKHLRWARAALVAASGVAWLGTMPAGAAEPAGSGTLPTRGRTAALLTALFHHDAPTEQRISVFRSVDGMEGASLGSLSPQQVERLAERGKVMKFAKTLVYEGGYFPREIYHLLGYEDAATAKVARVARQLDSAAGTAPAPWEVAGRIGRSGISGSSDHWAMAPGRDGATGLSTPGTLAYLPTLAVVYAGYPQDGQEAAAQLAVLKDDDIRAAPVARSALSLLTQILTSQSHDKNEWIRTAAADSRDIETENDVRALRVKDWRYLRGEECAMGRLERAVFIWYKNDGYDEIMAKGRELLRSRESLAYLAGLAAATYGMESLPKRVITSGASDRQLFEMINDLHDLATSEAVLRVAPEEE